MKKVLPVIIIAISVITTSTMAYGASYSDVKSGNWAYEAVNAMSEKTVISGYPDGSFKPSNTVTYGEFIKMALIAATKEDVGNSTSGNWADGYYNKALDLNYFTKADINQTNLSKPIDRAHMALIISSILGDIKIDNYDEIQKGITDITYKTSYEYDIAKSYACGILTGYTDNTFRPEKTLSRAEAATVIHRLVDESKRIIPTNGKPEAPLKSLDEMITNIKTFKNDDGSINKWLAAAETYEIDTNSLKYNMTLGQNNGTKWITFPASVEITLGQRYLMKDGQIVEFMDLTPHASGAANACYTTDITTIDYIVSLDVDHHIILITNPYKK